MNVKDKELYCLQSVYEYYNLGNEFVVDDDFKSQVNIFISDMDKLYDYEIRLYSDILFNMYDARAIINKIKKREKALEDYRQKYFDELPSRLNSLILYNERQLDYLKECLDNIDGANIYKVKVSGDIFETNTEHLPNLNSSNATMNMHCEDYWNPLFYAQEDYNKNEILFKGKVKIKEKIK